MCRGKLTEGLGDPYKTTDRRRAVEGGPKALSRVLNNPDHRAKGGGGSTSTFGAMRGGGESSLLNSIWKAWMNGGKLRGLKVHDSASVKEHASSRGKKRSRLYNGKGFCLGGAKVGGQR